MIWILTYALLLSGIGACLFLFLTLNVRHHISDKRLRGELETMREGLEAMSRKLEQAETELDERIAALAAPPDDEGVNLTKRAQVLRMHRRGETPEAIASALGMAQSEVDLMLKIQKMVLDGD